MSGYIGSKSSVTQVDGYNRTEADAEFVAKAGDTMTGPLSVTGTITADGLTVAGGITTTVPTVTLDVVEESSNADGLIGLSAEGSGRSQIRSTHSLGSASDLRLITDAGGSAKDRLKIASNGDISFYEDTGTTPKFFWDASAETLRLGEYNSAGTPSGSLFVDSNANNHAIHIEETGGGSESWQIGVDTDGDLGFYNSQSTTASVTFDDSGNVGIGTSTPSEFLHIYGGALGLQNGSSETITGKNHPVLYATLGSGSGLFSGYGNLVIQARDTGTATQSNIVFGTGSGATERMRIDASGNVLVGKTSGSFGTAGIALMATDQLRVTRSGDVCGSFNRLSTDGNILDFYGPSGLAGSIGTSGGLLNIGSGDTGLLFAPGSDAIIPSNPTNTANGGRDNVIDLGNTYNRFDDIYATNGTIQTSDRNEKQDVAALTATEMLVAARISGLFKTFRWIDSVADKGDDARTHTGVIAQDVQAAFIAEGLDVGDYALFISATWWETQTDVAAVEADEDNEIEAADAYTRTDTFDTLDEAPDGATERTRMGIRYPELLSFVGAYNEQRFASIETRLAALEGN